jgi:hypothetical protein
LYGYTPHGQGIVVMTNGDNGAALIDEILTSVANEYGWPEFQVIEKTAPAPDARLDAALAGACTSLGQPTEMIAGGGQLHLQSALLGSAHLALFRESASGYFTTVQDMTITLQRDGQGKVTGFSLQRGSATHQAARQH